MQNKNFNGSEDEIINKLRSARSKEELLSSIPDSMRERLNSVMSNEEELKRILNTERARALYDKLIEMDKEWLLWPIYNSYFHL